MEIQTIFYFLASICMFAGIVFFVGCILLLWRLEKSVLAFKKKTVENMSKFMDQKKLVGLVSLVGLGLKWIVERRNRGAS